MNLHIMCDVQIRIHLRASDDWFDNLRMFFGAISRSGDRGVSRSRGGQEGTRAKLLK